MKKTSQTILDSFFQIMPELRKTHSVNLAAATDLFNLWRNGQSKSSGRVFKKPVTLPQYNVKRMQEAGLVTAVGDEIEITTMGRNIIKTMILGDERSAFDDSGVIIAYDEALSNTKKTAKGKSTKRASSDWWSRFLE